MPVLSDIVVVVVVLCHVLFRELSTAYLYIDVSLYFPVLSIMSFTETISYLYGQYFFNALSSFFVTASFLCEGLFSRGISANNNTCFWGLKSAGTIDTSFRALRTYFGTDTQETRTMNRSVKPAIHAGRFLRMVR